jgi:L-fuculose-phosphate aldolase
VLEEMPAVHYTMLLLGGAPRVAPYATFGSQELADNVVTALAGRNAALMSNHGSIAYAKTMDEACERIEMLEWFAELYWRAHSIGEPRVLTDKDFEAVIMQAMAGGYGALHKAEQD